MRLVAAIALAVAALGSGAAFAQSPRFAIVARSAGDPPVPAASAGRAVARAAARRGAVVTDAAAVAERRAAAGVVTPDRLVGFADARELARQGWRHYLEVEAEPALARLSAARLRALEVADLDGGLELLADVSLRLGAVHLYLGNEAEAAANFRLAARLDPERAPSTAEFAPAIVAAYDAAVAATGAPRARLDVRLTAIGARVEVDGRPVEGAVLAADVEVGLHVVVVRAPGRHPFAQLVAVPADGVEVDVSLSPDPLRAGLAVDLDVGLDEQTAQAGLESLIVFAELDAVILVAPVWRRGAPALVAQWCEGTPLLCTAVVERGFARPEDLPSVAVAVFDALAGARGARRFPPTLLIDARVARGERRPGTRTPAGGSAWWKSPWLWAGVGGLAVAVTAGVLLSGDDGVSTTIRVPQCEFFGGC